MRIEANSEVMTVYLTGEIDHHEARDIRDEIDAGIDTLHPKTVILDFRDITFMDSSGIGLIMGRYRKVSEYGGKLEVANPSPQIDKVIKIAGLDRLAAVERTAK